MEQQAGREGKGVGDEDQVIASNLVALVGVGIVLGGCGTRVPEPSPHPEDVPHISWEIEIGPTGHQTVACQSESRMPCVVLASTDRQRSFATVHVYYHSARTDTKYEGTIQVGFFVGPAETHELKPSITVKANSRPVSQAVTDFVTTTPGHYTIHIAVQAARAPEHTETIRDDIDVEVRAVR